MSSSMLGFSAGAVTLGRAVEDNNAEFLLALGRAGGGEERVDKRVSWTIGGSPVDNHNAVVRADLAGGDADGIIAEAVARLRAHGVAGTWHLGPSSRPADLCARLLYHGFAFGADEPGMAADLSAVGAAEMPAGLSVARVQNAADLDEWIATLASGFGEGPHEAEWAGAMYRKIGFHEEEPWRLYVGRIDGRPIATASVFFAAGVAGIYFVFTLEEMRRRGIGAAITLAAMYDSRESGYRVAVLGSSPMGQQLYGRIGFHDVCVMPIYDWRP